MAQAYTMRALALIVVLTLTAILLTAVPRPVFAGKGGAFVGGLIGGHVLTNAANRSERRTQAAEYEAYHSQQPAAPAPQQAAPQASQSSEQSVEEKLDTLDQLAAKGYITQEEYQKRRRAILDSL